MNQRVSVIPAKAGIQAHLQGIPDRTSVREGTGSASVHGLFSDKSAPTVHAIIMLPLLRPEGDFLFLIPVLYLKPVPICLDPAT